MTTIRSMRGDDVEKVRELLDGSWRRTYGPLMGEERAAAESAVRHSRAKLTAELGNSDVIALVAAGDDGSIAGYAMTLRDRDGGVWLERLHVDPAVFGTGVAAGLLDTVFATHADEATLALEVIKGNDRAMAFYRKHGFVVVEERPACGSMIGVPAYVMSRASARV